jgi:hypothetical protein
MENINVKVINQNNVDIKVTPQVSNVVEVITPQPFSIKIDKGIIGPQGPVGPSGEGVPTGGTTGQALVKTSDSDYATGWSDTVSNALTADSATTADSAIYATSASSALTANNADHATNADHVPYSGLTGTVPTWNQDTTGNAATANYATSAGHANSSDTATYATSAGSATHATTADSATTATTASSVSHSLTAIADGTTQTFNGSSDVTIGSVPTAGTAGQVLAKIDSTNFNVGWIDNYSTALKTIVKNQTGSTLPKGTVVYVSGGTGANILIAKAQANAESTSSQTFGFLEDDIANGSSGYVINQGTLTGIDTSAYNDGDPVYLSPTVAGGWVAGLANKPYAPYHLVYLGTITRSQNNNGTIAVKVHNVSARNPVNGQTIIYNQSTSLWEKANITAGSGISITNGAGSITIANTSPSTGGTVTSVNTAGTVNGLTLTGGPITSSGTITLGGTLDLSSPPAIGGTTPAAGTFTTLTATGQTSLGGAAGSEGLRVNNIASSVNYWLAQGSVTNGGVQFRPSGGDTNIPALFSSKGGSQQSFYTNTFAQEQMRVSHTASAVNYVQVTGAATGSYPVISAQGSDSFSGLGFQAKSASILFFTRTGVQRSFNIADSTSTANYLQVQGAATTSAPILSAQGTDTNISQVFQSKGTGAIDLAAGSSGVNISNGGTVTAITRTANGSGYTSVPTITVSAPTTAGGVQATVTANMFLNTVVVAGGGTGYAVNDVLTLSGGTSSQAAQVTVTAVSAGVITAVSIGPQFGFYSVVPTSPVSVTGGTGTGATFTVTWGYSGATITNAGSGYVEQPTVSFSGGGGSGAAAYATVGTTTKLQSLGNSLSFYVPGGESFRVTDTGQTTGNYWQALATTATAIFRSSHATNAAQAHTGGTGSLLLGTNLGVTQLAVSHTASAVNYVQVTGAATTGAPTISVQGSDSAVSLNYSTKGTYSSHIFTGTQGNQFQITGPADGTNSANRFIVYGGKTGAAPILGAVGSDTNIDLALTPKGTGRVKFGTYTASAGLVTAGYIEIVDSGGTVRRLAVVS